MCQPLYELAQSPKKWTVASIYKKTGSSDGSINKCSIISYKYICNMLSDPGFIHSQIWSSFTAEASLSLSSRNFKVLLAQQRFQLVKCYWKEAEAWRKWNKIYPNSCQEGGTEPRIGWQWIQQEWWKVRIKTSTHWLVGDVSLQGNPSPERGFSVCRKKSWTNAHSYAAYTLLWLHFPYSYLCLSLISYSTLSLPPEEGV